MHTHSRA